MSDTTHPYAEQIRAALMQVRRVECPQPDGAVIAVVVLVAQGRVEVDVHLPGEAVPDIGEHIGDIEAGRYTLPSGARVPERPLSRYRTTIDGLTVTTYATRR